MKKCLNQLLEDFDRKLAMIKKKIHNFFFPYVLPILLNLEKILLFYWGLKQTISFNFYCELQFSSKFKSNIYPKELCLIYILEIAKFIHFTCI